MQVHAMTESKFNWGLIFWILYVVVGLVQINATYAGLKYWLGWHWLVLGPLAFIVGYIPLVGSLSGVVGAHMVWRWEVLPSLLLFFWYVPLYVGFLVTSFVFSSSGKNQTNTAVDDSIFTEEDEKTPHRSTVISRKKKNVFSRVVAGDLTLWVTFWIFGVLFLKFFEALIYLCFREATMSFWIDFMSSFGMRSFQIVTMTILLSFLLYKIVIIRGIWLSSNKYIGPTIWSATTKFFMVLWSIAIIPDLLEISKILKLKVAEEITVPLGSLDLYRDMVRQLLN